MGEAKDKEAAQAAADAEFQKMLSTPLSREDAEKELADIDVKKMQLAVVRQKWAAQITQIQLNLANLDEQALSLDMAKAMVFRRALNKPTASDKAFAGAEVAGG